MFGDISRALGQMGDPRFLRVLLWGVGLSVGALAVFSWVVMAGTGWLLPETVELPWVHWDLGLGWLSWGALAAALVLSIFLMVPVAAVFVGFFLDGVANAVEARHYPGLPPAREMGLAEAASDGIRFLGIMVLANAVALVIYLLSTVLAPVIFWIVNGYLLGREYFQLVALRRLPPAEAARMRRANGMEIWLAGALMAVPLTLPVVNLAVPVLGVAAYTHMYHRLARR